MEIQVKKLNENAILPLYQTEGAAGADLCACLSAPVDIVPGQTAFIPTGLAIAVPNGYGGFVFARSGLACKKGLAPANKVGVIDADYRGEVMVALHNHGQEIQTITPGDRIAQLVVLPVAVANFISVDQLDDTTRGEGGFGSTGM